MNKFNNKLWNSFLQIAQPYFYPLEPGGNKVFLGLLFLLLMFLFAAVFLVVSLICLVNEAIFGESFNSIAPGLVNTIHNIINSHWIFVIALMFVVPAIGFWYYKKQLIPRWQPWALLSLLLLLSLSVSGLNVIISYVGNFFTTALSEKDQPTFWRFLYVYAGVFIVGTPIVVIYTYTRQKLGLYWREWMTNKFLNNYLENRSYYEIDSKGKIDNPDQRIAEDIKSFTNQSLFFILTILNSIIDVISFTGILWSISIPLSIFLIIYAVAGTLVAVIFGRKLIPLNFYQLKREADFRYGLVHIRDHAESIAFYRGEEQELSQIRQRFTQVFNNFNLLIGWQRNVDYFTTGYRYAVIILPSLIMAPIYFAGEIKFGDISQAGFAFSQVLGAFSLVVSQIDNLTNFAAGINRLDKFRETLEDTRKVSEVGTREIDVTESSRLALENITLNTPLNHEEINESQKTLVKNLSVAVKSGQGLLIVGKSGAGKSSLLRGIAGLWTSGTGRLVRPNLEEILFLPQRPYMILGSLREQLLYPQVNQEFNEYELRNILKVVNLEDLPDRLDGFDVELPWENVLSLGEQQRLAFARLLLIKPDYAILDEATSALDLQNEAELYEKLQATQTTFVSVGHRLSLLKYHQQVLELTGDANWRVLSAEDYQAEASSYN
ncbi:MAG: ABC transporter ATP-binding protein/permease [Okeania sp. SIO2C2]|uniref:ABC transporter ATP-binding protein/permease n=1 Tax=Okeania sp. SIO2C2 TaxID=2607787 RepID=UPI0013BCE590|nr:ABC transporter ATP-binding protein/permease [Okeania sp. SIO2C2]NEP86416.1 ABC transporter ATP-binding protein/permease [Okeania sp. SIO2C2]